VSSTELWRMGATELAAIIRSRQASAIEVIEAHLRRIESVNPALNAVTVTLAEEAMAAAKAADLLAMAGGELPPLHGVPFTVKETIDVAGTPTTQGVQALTDAYPTRDAPVVERLRAAGAIPIGRTNCPDLGIRWHAESQLHGATINPWDRALTPGGSSGGEASALATGMTPLGLGNDLGGSLRWPAQCCGITALKPTLGRIPHASTIEPADLPISIQLILVEGPMARRVADLRAALEIMAGPTWRDPWSVPAPLRGPETTLPIRVALVVDPGGLGTARQVQQGVRVAARALTDAGYQVDEIEPPSLDAAARIWLDILAPDWRAGFSMWTPPWGAPTHQFVTALLEVAADRDPMSATQGFLTRQSLLRSWGQFQQTYPLIVAPVYTELPWPGDKDQTTDGVTEILYGMRMTLAVSALGLPSVALPVGTRDGLPQSVQIIAPRYREDLCLDAAGALEQRVGILTPIDPRTDRADE
jgi:amidase